MKFKYKILLTVISLMIILPNNMSICFASYDGYEYHDIMNVYTDYYDPWGNDVKRNRNFASIGPDGYIKVPDVDFSDGIGSVELTIATEEPHVGKIIITADAPDGKKIATVDVVCSNNWNVPVKSISGINSDVEGVHDIYFTYGETTCNFFGFQFSPKPANPANFTYSGSVKYTDTSDTVYRDDIFLMSQLGAYDIFPVGELNIYEPVTRGEFAHVMAAVIESKGSTNDCFPDISDSPYKEDINSLFVGGIITGGAETKFLPDDFMKVEDALEPAYRLLGYDLLGKNNASMMKAESRLMTGIENEYVFNRATLAKFMHNLLLADYVNTSFDKDGRMSHTICDNGILSNTLGIKSAYGVITNNSNTGLHNPDSNLGIGYIGIDNIYYNTIDNNLDNLIGFGVEYYYKDDTLIAAIPDRTTKQTVITTKDSEIVSIDYKEIVYDTGKKRQKENIPDKSSILYNGKAVDFDFREIAADFKGDIYIIKNKDKSCVISIWGYTAIIADKVGEDEISDSLSHEKYILSSDTKVEFYDGNMSCLLRTINSGDVLLIWQSRNNVGEKLIKVVKNNIKISGTVTSVSNKDCFINGDKYELTDELNGKIKAGSTGEFTVNSYNEILKFTPGEIKLSMGCLESYRSFGSDEDEEGGIFKIYTTESKLETFKWVKQIVVDGVKYKKSAGVETVIGQLDNPSLVCYGVDGNKNIVVIDTYLSNRGGANDQLRKLNSSSESGYYRNNSYLKNGRTKYYFARDAHLFVNWNLGVDKLITYEPNAAWLPKDQLSTVDLYNFDVSNSMVEYVFWKDRTILSYDGAMVVDDIFEMLDDDDDIAKYISGYVNGESKTYKIHKEWYEQNPDVRKLFDSISKGDILLFKLYDSSVIECKIVYFADKSVSKNGINSMMGNNSIYGDGYQDCTFLKGRVTGKENDYLKLSTGNEQENCFVSASAAKCLIIKNNKIVPKISSNEIGTGDEIIVWYSNAEAREIYILDN